jgi:hypothetical protein
MYASKKMVIKKEEIFVTELVTDCSQENKVVKNNWNELNYAVVCILLKQSSK